MFGGQNAFGGGFGQQSQPQSMFGAQFGGFGTTTSASAGGVGGTGGFGGFGQPTPAGSSSFAFGQPSSTPTGGMFAQSGNPFGNTGITSSSVASTLTPNGTLSPPYSTTSDKDPSGTTNTFHSITAMPQYRNFSFEELRLADYQLNRKPSTATSYGGGINTPAYMGATSTGGGFGGFGSQNIGFGAKTTPSFAFSNNPTPTPAVGFGATPAGPSNQSLFGTQKPAFGAPTGAFGSTTQPTGNFGTGFGGGGSLFGSTSSGTQPSIFGQKTQPAVSTSGFGATVGGFNTPSFGFGNKTTTIAGGFGTPASNPSFSGFGGGGGGATTNTPSLNNMGGFVSVSKPFGFNQTSVGAGTNFLAPTTSNSMFNLNPAASTTTPSLSFNNTFNKPAVPTLGGSSLTNLQAQPSGYLGGGSLSFGSTSTATAFGNTGQNQGLQATVNSTPYGEISVFQATTPTVTPNKPSVAATPLAASPLKKKPVGTPSYKLTPRPSSKLKLAGFNSPAYSYPGFGTPDPKPLHIFESLDKKEILSPEAFIKRNPRKLVLDRSVEAEELLSGTDSQIGSPQNDHTPVRQRVSFDAKLESGADSIYHSYSPNSIKPSSSRQIEFSDNITSTPSKTPSKTPLKTHIETDSSPKIEEISNSPSPDNNGYYSIPSVKDLSEMKSEELKAVIGFMVGRTNFGKIEFQDPVDFSDVTSLDDVPGKIIRFEDQNCTVYGPDYNKPPPGHGLNKRAVITLDRCWALDKSDRRPIKDPEDLRYRQRIERLKNVSDTKYITFLPETGSWVFQVEHFTTYGLIFDDPEDQFEEKQYQPFEVPIIHMTEAKPFPQSRKGKEKEYDDDKLKPITNFPESLGQDPDDIDEMQNVLFNDSNEEDYMQMDIAGDSVIEDFDDSHKRSLEGDEHDEYIKAENHSSVVEPRQSFVKTPRISHEDVVIRLPSKYRKVVDYAESIVFGKENYKEDLGLMMGRSFRVGWGPNGMLVRCSKVCGISNIISAFSPKSKNTGLSKNTGMPTIIQFKKIKLFTDAEDKEKVRHDSLMKFIFNNSVFGQEDGIPHVDLAEINFENLLKSFENGTISRHEALIWKLGQALWDDIVIPGANQDDLEDFGKLTEEHRKERISKWFREAVSPQATAHIKRALASDDKGEAIFGHLTNRNILSASKIAIKNRDFRLAALLSQLCGNDQFFRDQIKNQIEHWQQTGLIKLIPKSHLRLYEIMAGNVVTSSQGLDWKRSLGMHLWYGRFLDETFVESFNDYEDARRTSIPIPWYKEDFEKKPSLSWPESENEEEILDIHYHLLKLAVDKTHPLDDAILPRSITPSPLDYRVTWLLHVMLARTLRIRDFVNQGLSADRVTLNFVTQLEVLELWQWALLASLFLNEPHVRKMVICELLNRLVSTMPVDQLENIEKFAVDQLKIPHEWIAKAKALHSKYREEIMDEAIHLLTAGDVSDAHKIVVTKIAPESILHKKHKELQEILEKIDPRSVPDWDLGGKIFLDYLVFIATANVEEEERNPAKITDLMGVCQNIIIGLAKMKPVDFRYEQCISYMEYLTNQVLSQIEGCDIKHMKFRPIDKISIEI